MTEDEIKKTQCTRCKKQLVIAKKTDNLIVAICPRCQWEHHYKQKPKGGGNIY